MALNQRRGLGSGDLRGGLNLVRTELIWSFTLVIYLIKVCIRGFKWCSVAA